MITAEIETMMLTEAEMNELVEGRSDHESAAPLDYATSSPVELIGRGAVRDRLIYVCLYPATHRSDSAAIASSKSLKCDRINSRTSESS